MPLRGGECVYYQLSRCQKGARCQFYHRPLEPDICRSFLFQKCKYQTNPRQCGKRHVRCQDLPLPSQTELDRVKQVQIDAKEDASKTQSDDEFSTSSGSTHRQTSQTAGSSEKPGQVLGCFDCGVKVASPWELKEHVESQDHQQIVKRLELSGVEVEGVADDFSHWCIDCNVKLNSTSHSQHHARGKFHAAMMNALKQVKLAILTGGFWVRFLDPVPSVYSFWQPSLHRAFPRHHGHEYLRPHFQHQQCRLQQDNHQVHAQKLGPGRIIQ